jgi:hypothetical protein
MANMTNPNAGIQMTKLTSNSAVALEQLWAVREEYDTTNWKRVFKYIQAASDTTIANWTVVGHLAAATDATRLIASSDVWNNDTDPNYVLGVWIWDITASYYGWIQIYGYHPVIKTDWGDDIAATVSLFLDPTVSWTCDSMAADTASTNKILGYAVTDDINWDNTVAWFITVWE